MKRLISGVLILKISYIILVCHALNCDQPTNNNIRLSWSDPRLFVYDDSIFINRYLIDSMLKNMCEKHNNKADSVLTSVGNMAISHDRFDDIFIIVLANQFVRDGDLKVPLQSYPPIPGGYIRKGDLCKLYRSFLGVTYIEAKDIIDIVNLNKKFNCIINKHLNCNMEYLKWSDMMYFDFDVLECQMDRISRKYKYGIINNNSCPEAYSIANDSTLTIEERIENLTCMIEDVVKSYIHDFPDIEQNKIILDWKRDIDSLRSLPICRH